MHHPQKLSGSTLNLKVYMHVRLVPKFNAVKTFPRRITGRI
jgi:hypothetical protein